MEYQAPCTRQPQVVHLPGRTGMRNRAGLARWGPGEQQGESAPGLDPFNEVLTRSLPVNDVKLEFYNYTGKPHCAGGPTNAGLG